MRQDVNLTPEQEAMVKDGARLARLAAGEYATGDRHQLALLVVELRESFQDDAGAPDYRGNSGDYKATIAKLYADSGLRKVDRERVKYAVSHHVSNILRDLLTPEQLAYYRLSPKGQNARRAARRDERGET